MASYSFLDVVASLIGPTGNINLGSGAANAEEGITTAMIEDRGTMTIGADGSVMHSLHGGKGATLTVRLLKTSPVNALLAAAYNAQTVSSALWGTNLIVIRNPVTGDTISCRQTAFRKVPDLTYAKIGGTNEWTFNVGLMDVQLGSGAAVADQGA